MDAFAGLGQQRRVKTPQHRQVVVHRLGRSQIKGVAHRHEVGRLVRRGAIGLGTEKQQVVQQGLGHLALTPGERGELQQDARSRPLDVHVHRQQALGQGFKIGRCHAPEGPHPGIGGTGGQSTAEPGQLLCGRGALGLDHQQHQPVEQQALGSIALRRRRALRGLDHHATLIERPQIGGMHTFGRGQLLHLPVLRKQRHGLNGLVVEHRLQVFDQGKTGPLDLACGLLVAHLWTLHETLHRGFHRPQHLGRREQAHHLQGANGLMQLLASDPQRTRVHRLQVVTAGSFRLAHEALDGLVGRVERLAQLVEHPGQRTEVGERGVRLQTVGGGVEHDHQSGWCTGAGGLRRS